MRKAWERRRLVPVSEETRKRYSIAGKGKVISLEQREKIRASMVGRSMPWAWKIAAKNRGGTQTAESNAKRRTTLLGRKFPEERRVKAAAKLLEVIRRPEVIAKKREKRMLQVLPKRDTLPELKLRSLLVSEGVDFVTHKEIEGARSIGFFHQYDFLVRSKVLAIEMNGCYWHGCERCFPAPNDFQLQARRRDKEIEEATSRLGWKLQVVWEHDIPGMRCVPPL